MDPDRLNRLEPIFQKALALPADQRAAFLDAECGSDGELRAEIEALLASDARAEYEAFLEGLPAPWLDGAPPAESHHVFDPIIGKEIGPYKVFRRLGQGGMGDVYQAVRQHPFRQYVALKIIRRGMESREGIARFEMERQILASLNHPNIARLTDGGVTAEGLPYLVLDYVDGQPITAYCDDRRMTVAERVRLFTKVCYAVHYAHQNLVIHRDLKPSNIFVTELGTVKLLDFGIAKLLNPHLSPIELPVTRTDLRPMTPEYASPEQVRGQTLTTAADVYSLGVVLYELLAGARPYELTGAGPHEVVAAVCEQEPVRPSARVSTAADRRSPASDREKIAERRGSTLDRLRRQIQGDLDNITLTALRKEPDRRYASAEQFGQDLERYLDGLPVIARPNTLGYRMRKFVARHRTAMAAAALGVVSLLVGTGVAVWQAGEAHRARVVAEQSQREAEEVSGFLERLFAASDPYAPTVVRQDTIRMREFLERGVDRLGAELAGEPLVRARLFDVAGMVYRNLGLLEEAVPMVDRALADRRALLGPDHPQVAQSLVNRGLLASEMSDFERARELLAEALRINVRAYGGQSVAAAVNQNQLAVALRRLGHFEEAESLHVDALRVLREQVGDRDPRVAIVLNDLMATLEDSGVYAEAERYGRESVALHRKLYGRSHPQLALALRNLGLVLQRVGRYVEAEALFRESIAIAEETLGPEHPQMADLLNRLASIRWWQNDFTAADSIHRQSLALKRRIYGNTHIEVAFGLNNIGSVLRDMGRFDEAEAALREALDVERATVGADHPTYFISLANLGTVYWARGDCEGGIPIMQASIEGLERTIPRDATRAPTEHRYLGDCFRMMGRFEEAERHLLHALRMLESSTGRDHEHTQRAIDRLVALYTDWNRPDEAARYRAMVALP